MIVVTDAGPTLESPEDCKRFHVEVRGAGDLGGAGAWADDGEHALIDVDWVRQQAAGRVPDGWDADFEGMLGYARSKGWIEGSAIRAHLER